MMRQKGKIGFNNCYVNAPRDVNKYGGYNVIETSSESKEMRDVKNSDEQKYKGNSPCLL
jgi:hypothetical protein